MTEVKKNQGFTLIELVFVITIISILVAATAPNYFNIFDRAWRITDEANLKNLNQASWLYRELEAASFRDDFLLAGNNQQRLELLLKKDFIDQIPISRQKGQIFFWHKDKEAWIMAEEEREDYEFYQFAQGFSKFIYPTPGPSYTVNVRLDLREEETEAGLFFNYGPDENNLWKGFILQIEKNKGQGALVVRRLIADEPGEEIMGYTFNHNNTYAIPDKESSLGQEWWSGVRLISLDISSDNRIAGYIDNYLLFDDFHLPLFGQNEEIYTGFLVSKGDNSVLDMEIY